MKISKKLVKLLHPIQMYFMIQEFLEVEEYRAPKYEDYLDKQLYKYNVKARKSIKKIEKILES